jgi:hypothetical protein
LDVHTTVADLEQERVSVVLKVQTQAERVILASEDCEASHAELVDSKRVGRWVLGCEWTRLPHVSEEDVQGRAPRNKETIKIVCAIVSERNAAKRTKVKIVLEAVDCEREPGQRILEIDLRLRVQLTISKNEIERWKKKPFRMRNSNTYQSTACR